MEMDKGDSIRKSVEDATVGENTEIGDCMPSMPSMQYEHKPCHSTEGFPFQDSSKMLFRQLSVECIPENNGNASNHEDATDNEGNHRGNFETGANNNINSHAILAGGNNASDDYYLKTHDVSNKVKREIGKPSHIEIYSHAVTHDEITGGCPNLDVISGTFAKSCNPGADAAPGINGGLKMDEGVDIDTITTLDFIANSNNTVNKELLCSDNIACGGSNRPSSTSSIADGIAEGGEKTNWVEVKDELETVTSQIDEESKTKPHANLMHEVDSKCIRQSFNCETQLEDVSESGTEEEQATFMMELENFYKEWNLEFKPPKFYGEGLNCLKLWRAVIRLGGYDQVTSCKLWRQVGESFRPPKTCTTVSWTFRCFYEKALLEYEKYQMHGEEYSVPDHPLTEMTNSTTKTGSNARSGRARRDAAARAMQGWHSQRFLSNGEVSDPIIKDKNSSSTQKREKQLKNTGLLKRKKSSAVDRAIKSARFKAAKMQLDATIVDVGSSADWVKVNVQKTKDCFEIYALVPGLLREEVRVQSDPAGRLIISGDPEHPDNPWGVTPFKKVVSLSSRIDPHQASAVVTLHGQLFVRLPFEHSHP